MLQVYIPVWIPGRRGEDCDQQEGDDVQVQLHVQHCCRQHRQHCEHWHYMAMTKMSCGFLTENFFCGNFFSQLGREHCEGAPTSRYAGLGRRLFFKGEFSSLFHFLLAPSGALIAIPTYYWYTHPLFQITPVLNTGLSLSEPLQLNQRQSLDSICRICRI